MKQANNKLQNNENNLKKKIIIVSILSIMIVITAVMQTVDFFNNREQENLKIEKRNSSSYNVPSSAKEVVKDMKLGWNLGNTLDSPDGQNKVIESSYYETLWENPVTTKEMISKVKTSGFNAIRIPVTWYDHVYYEDVSGHKVKDIDINNLTVDQIKNIKIEEKWMQRVKDVVNYARDNQLYIILNVHHDVGHGAWPWIFASTDTTKRNKYEAVLEMLWKQIAEEFKNYDNQLLFEGYNELMIDGATSWVGSYETDKVTSAHFDAANRLNQKFVDTVRSTGGNNATRFLVLNTYGAEAVAQAVDNFKFPTDTVENHLILSAHIYDWDGTYQSGNNNSLYASFQRLAGKANSANAGLIIGEFGTRTGYVGDSKAATALNYYVRTAKSLGITCFYWDEGTGKNATMNLLDRKELTWIYPRVLEGLVKGSEGQELSNDVVDEDVEPTSITLNHSNLTIDYNSKERVTLKATIKPANAGKSTKITWTSSDTNILTVGPTGNLAPKGIPELINIQGNFAGGAEGTVTVTATITTESGKTLSASCQVTVTNKVKGNIKDVNLADINNWRKGFYDWQKGYYFANGEDRICVDGYLEVEPNTKYTAKITGENLVFTVREITKDHVLVNSTLLRNGESLTTRADTEYVALSMHKITDTSEEAVKMTLDDFEEEFNKNIEVSLASEDETTPENPPTVKAIAVTKKPDKTTYIKGENLDLTGGIVTITYSNEKKTTLPMTSSEFRITGYNSNTVGIQMVMISYEGKIAIFNVNVTNDINRIELKTKPNKTTYIKGENLDLTAGTISVIYQDGTSTEVSMNASDVQVTGYNSNQIGSQTLTVTYQGKQTTFNVTVKNDIEKIEVKKAPDKTTYIKGEALDLSGGIITVSYEDKTTADIPMTSNDVKISGFDSDETGNQAVTVTYQGKQTTFNVTVKNDIEKIEVKKTPDKTTYIKGESLDLTGGIITVSYEDKTTDNIPMTSSNVKVSGYNSSQVGNQTITVTYQGRQTTFEVTVKNEVTLITIKKEINKTTYIKGETLDLSGGIITVSYEDKTTADIPMTSSEVQVTGYNSNQIGNQTLTITYQGKTLTFEVIVKNEVNNITIKTNPTKTTYIKGESLDLSGGVITASYEDKTTADIPMTSSEVQITGYNASKTGKQTITVTYQGRQTTFEVTVKNDIEKIEIKTKPSKITYIKGEALDVTGGIITVLYEDNTSATIPMTSSDIEITGYNRNELGTQTITVTYQGQQTTFEVTVKNEISKIEVSSKPSKTSYIKGENLDLTGGTISAVYQDNTSSIISMTSSDVQITGYDSNQIGNQTVIVTYQGQQTTFEVTVKNNIVGIQIKTRPTKTTYIRGENLDLSSGVILVSYEDGSISNIPMTANQVQVSGYDANNLGQQTITVTYQGQQTTFEVTVKNDVTGIIIKQGIYKTTYIKGETLDLTGGIITVLYEDNTTANIPMTSNDLQITGYNSNKIGQQTITVTYQRQFAIFNVTVRNSITGISIKNNINKTTYIKGETLDLTGGVLTVSYGDGNKADVPMTSSDVKVTGFDSNNVGNQTITVTYQGKTITFNVTIKDEIERITIKTNPLKTVYTKGEELDLTNGVINVVYSDGKTASIPMTSKEIEISGYDNITSGEQTITVTYRGQQTSFKITVKDEVEKITIKSNPTKTVYKKGDPLNLEGGIITVIYKDETTSEIKMSSNEVKVTGYNNTKPGTQKVTVIYEEKEASFEVTVEEENNMLLIIGGTATTIAVAGVVILVGITLRKRRLKNKGL